MLTDNQICKFVGLNFIQNNTPLQKNPSKLELEDNYYENLFLEEMQFKCEPKKHNISNLLRQYCKSVEYFLLLEDDKKAQQYKTLIDLFLNNPTVLNLLEGKENSDNTNNNFMKKYIIANKNRIMNNSFIEDDINCNYEKLNNLININEYNNLINNKENLDNNRVSYNIINEEIKNQQNNFHKNLNMRKSILNKKEKKEKRDKREKPININENKLIQSIQNAFINDKLEKEQKNEVKKNNLIVIDQQISPIKIEQNSSNKQNILNINTFIFSNSNNPNNISEKEQNKNINLIINRKNTSEFEPLTPNNFYNLEQSDENNKNRNEKSINNMKDNFEEINETNDFSINDSEDIKNKSQNNNNSIIKYNEINSNETKDSYSINISSISNISKISNISSITKNLNDSIYKKNILKSFRLDFNDLFEFIKQSHTINKKQRLFCKEIKNIIENYIIDYNKYLNEKILIKLVNKFSNIWDDMFNNYMNISEIYDREIKKNEDKINNCVQDDKINELNNISENLKNEKENEINKLEEKLSSKIKATSIDFKNNYNNIDKEVLILNEKFLLNITKAIFDIINSNNV